MEHLFLLRDIFDLLNSYALDGVLDTEEMRKRINAYVDAQGYEIMYIDEKVGLFKNGVVIQ
jgi:hypothetical protein